MAYGYQRGNTWVYKTNRRDLPLLTDYPYLFASQYWTGQLYQDKSYIASPHTRTVRDRHLWTPPEKNLALKQTRSHIPTRRKRNKNGVHIAATDFCTHQKNEVADDERPSDALCSRSVRRRSHDLSPFTCVQLYTRNNSHTLGYYPTLLSNVATSLLPQFYDGILAITHAHTRNITVCDVTVARRAPAIHQSIHTTTVHTNSYKYGRQKSAHTTHTQVFN